MTTNPNMKGHQKNESVAVAVKLARIGKVKITSEPEVTNVKQAARSSLLHSVEFL